MTTPISGGTPPMPLSTTLRDAAPVAAGSAPGGNLRATGADRQLPPSIKGPPADGTAPRVPIPDIRMDTDQWLLELSAWTAEFGDLMAEGMKGRLEGAIESKSAQLEKTLDQLAEARKKQDAAEATARKRKIIGWVTKSLATVGLAIAFGASAAAAGATGGAATPLAVVTGMMLAASVSSLASDISKEAGGSGWSYEGGLKDAGMGTFDSALLGSFLSGNLAGMAGAAAAKWTNDPQVIAIVTITVSVLQMAAMAGAGAAGTASQASGKATIALQIGGQVAGGAAQVADGALGVEVAKLELAAANIMAELKDLQAMMDLLQDFIDSAFEHLQEMSQQMLDQQAQAGEILLGFMASRDTLARDVQGQPNFS